MVVAGFGRDLNIRPATCCAREPLLRRETRGGHTFAPLCVSRKSVASLVVKLATTPGLEVRHSLGVSKPE
jgi:hypothetical protein